MELYLVRHGQSEGNVLKNFHGQLDYPLTDLGRQQARATADKLKHISFTRCMASDLTRAWDTALPCLEGRSVTPEKTPDLREQYVGDMEGLSWEEMEEKFPGFAMVYLENWFHTVPPNGESPADMERRVARAVQNAVDVGEDTLLVGHFGSLSLVLKVLGIAGEGQLLREGWLIGQGCYTHIHIEEGKATLIGLNL